MGLLCKGCNTLFRITAVYPIITSKKPCKCPYCGSDAEETTFDFKYWEHMGAKLNLPPYLVKEMFAAWKMSEVTNFIEYATKIIEEVDAKST